MDKITQQQAREQGFTIDTCCNPPFAYKGPRFQPTDRRECFTDLEAEQAERIRELEMIFETANETAVRLVNENKRLQSELGSLRKQQSEPVAILNLSNSEPEVELLDISGMKNGDKLYCEAAPKQQQEHTEDRADECDCTNTVHQCTDAKNCKVVARFLGAERLAWEPKPGNGLTSASPTAATRNSRQR